MYVLCCRLFIPAFWWHQVTSVKETISINIFWGDAGVNDFLTKVMVRLRGISSIKHVMFHTRHHVLSGTSNSIWPKWEIPSWTLCPVWAHSGKVWESMCPILLLLLSMKFCDPTTVQSLNDERTLKNCYKIHYF